VIACLVTDQGEIEDGRALVEHIYQLYHGLMGLEREDKVLFLTQTYGITIVKSLGRECVIGTYIHYGGSR
jgi:hypothetical protein